MSNMGRTKKRCPAASSTSTSQKSPRKGLASLEEERMVSLEEERMVSSTHASSVMAQFASLWRSKQMCDGTLVAEGKTFHVHRAYVAACSDYFLAMLGSGNFQEAQQQQIELAGVTASGLEAVLEFAYTGAISITQTTLRGVLEAAAHLQFSDVKDFCRQYLKKHVKVENCLEFMELAETYDLQDCQNEVKTYMLNNFSLLAAAPTTLTSMTSQLLTSLLEDDELRVDRELDVFRAVLQWVDATPERAELAPDMLNLVRFGLMDADQMTVVYNEQRMFTALCQPLLRDAIAYHANIFKQPLFEGVISQPRCHVDSIATFGGTRAGSRLCSHIIAAKLIPGESPTQIDTLTPITLPRSNSAIAMVNNFCFIVGGEVPWSGRGFNATAFAFRYDSRNGRWQQLSLMLNQRSHFAIAAVNDGILAVGGRNKDGNLSSTELYKYSGDVWVPMASYPTDVYGHSACSVNKVMYVIGGKCSGQIVNCLYKYEQDENSWKQLAPMQQSRYFHTSVCHDERVYVYGGLCTVEHSDARDNVRDNVAMFETYVPESDQWTVLAPAPMSLFHSAAVLGHRGLIYILGGFDLVTNQYTDEIQVYDGAANSWTVLELHLPERLSSMAACRVQLPRNLYAQSPSNA